MVGITVFMLVEARRYRAYDMWRERVRMLQRNVFAAGLDPSRDINDEWRGLLSRRYANPEPRISREEAIAHGLRRIYLPLHVILGLAWIARISAFTREPWLEAASIAGVHGAIVVALIALVLLAFVVVAYRPRSWKTGGELLDNEPRIRRE